MQRVVRHHITTVFFALLCTLIILSGCSAASSNIEAKDQQTQNRQYLSNVSQIMSNLTTELDEFIDAVSEGDLVTMRLEASDASKMIDDLNSLSVPEDLHDVHDSYVDGCTLLEQALSDYVVLYSDIESSGESLDSGAFDTRLNDIQKMYDAGIAKLSEGDEEAASISESVSESSASELSSSSTSV